MSQRKVFIGTQEVASLTAVYAKGFAEAGYRTRTLVVRKNAYYLDSHYDVVVDTYPMGSPASIFKKLFRLVRRHTVLAIEFVRALATCDTFLFLSGSSLLPAYLDYPILKLFRKRIICEFNGSDIRHGHAFRQHMHQRGDDAEIEPFIALTETYPLPYNKLLRRVRAAERYGDLILSQAGYAQLQTRPYMRLNIPMDLSMFRFHYPDREVPLVLHVPSNPAVKGTDRVLAAVEQLISEGVQFEFKLIKNTPNAQVREMLAESDIVVDELYADTVGVLSTEAMATGNVTLVRYAPDLGLVPSDCPAVNTNINTLVDKLREVIQNRELRRKLAYEGRAFVEAHHDHVQVVKEIIGWLEPGGIRQYDYVPEFYKELVIPPELIKEERAKVIRYWLSKLTGNSQVPASKKS